MLSDRELDKVIESNRQIPAIGHVSRALEDGKLEKAREVAQAVSAVSYAVPQMVNEIRALRNQLRETQSTLAELVVSHHRKG